MLIKSHNPVPIVANEDLLYGFKNGNVKRLINQFEQYHVSVGVVPNVLLKDIGT